VDFTEARDSEWEWHQLGHMQVCTLLQTDDHANTPPLSFLQARYLSCRPCQKNSSIHTAVWIELQLVTDRHKAIASTSKHWRHSTITDNMVKKIYHMKMQTHLKCLWNESQFIRKSEEYWYCSNKLRAVRSTDWQSELFHSTKSTAFVRRSSLKLTQTWTRGEQRKDWHCRHNFNPFN